MRSSGGRISATPSGVSRKTSTVVGSGSKAFGCFMARLWGNFFPILFCFSKTAERLDGKPEAGYVPWAVEERRACPGASGSGLLLLGGAVPRAGRRRRPHAPSHARALWSPARPSSRSPRAAHGATELRRGFRCRLWPSRARSAAFTCLWPPAGASPRPGAAVIFH